MVGWVVGSGEGVGVSVGSAVISVGVGWGGGGVVWQAVRRRVIVRDRVMINFKQGPPSYLRSWKMQGISAFENQQLAYTVLAPIQNPIRRSPHLAAATRGKTRQRWGLIALPLKGHVKQQALNGLQAHIDLADLTLNFRQGKSPTSRLRRRRQ